MSLKKYLMTTKKNKSSNSILKEYYKGTQSPYYSYSMFLKEKFKEKVYKVPIHLKGTCPNRDGTCGQGGCIFCGEEGGSFEWESLGTIADQISFNKTQMNKRYKAKKFIAYFQNFTNTYLPLEKFTTNLKEAKVEGIVGMNIATRPDCIPNEYIDVLADLNKDYLVTVELGLQSVNDETLKIINRGHDLSCYIDTVNRLKENNLRVSTHLILDLPWDTREDIVMAAKTMNQVKSDEVKIHNLYIVKGSKLGKLYSENKFTPSSMEEFIERTILFLENLDPNIVIGRLTGRAPQEEVELANWNRSWYFVRDEIIKRMLISDRYQGSKHTL